MNPRVLPRVLGPVVAAVLCLGIVPATAAQPRGSESVAKPSPSAPDAERDGEHVLRRHHVRVGEGSPTVTISDEAYVPKGEVHHDDIVCILGKVRIEGEVTGDVVVIMGSLDLSGTVRGDVVGIMSPTHIRENAEIGGDLVSVGGPLDRSPSSSVGGQEVKLNFMDMIPFMKEGWGGFWRFLFILKLIFLALLFLAICLITALVPRRLSTIAAAFPSRWGMAILVGLLGYCVSVVLFFILICTFIGIPLAFALLFAAKVIKWLGLAGIFFLMGHTMGRNVFKRELSHFAAVLGGFAVYALISLVPIIGFIFSTILSILGLGIALLTRFGAEDGWRKSGGSPVANVASPPVSPAGAPPLYSPAPGAGA
jgi:hypothetical protein